MIKFIAELDTSDVYGPLYVAEIGNTREEAMNKIVEYLKTHVGDYKQFLEDIKIEEFLDDKEGQN